MDNKILFDLNKLGKIEKGIFIKRLNRFVGVCKVNNKLKTMHIADTGRLTEIFIPNREVLLIKNRAELKTDYKLIGVWSDLNYWILVNTSLHSKIVKKAIEYGLLGFIPEKIKPEIKINNHSRLDFLVNNNIYVEVKGCNLLVFKDNLKIGLFPDAPTVRGKKHIEELIILSKENNKSIILILGLHDFNCFSPNFKMDNNFSLEFINALKNGVEYIGFKIKIDKNYNVVYNGKLELCNNVKKLIEN